MIQQALQKKIDKKLKPMAQKITIIMLPEKYL